MKKQIEEYDAFIDDQGTLFQRVSDNQYDYQLNDDFGKDYCTIDQMKDWGVKVDKVVTIGESL